ncbi:MAG: hypothetical protein ACK6DA_01265 [Candidatus Kapaibacterium sp.]|jgi:hypothetical protein
MNAVSGRIVYRYDMTLKSNEMNNGYGYFLTGTQTPLDLMFMGLTRDDVVRSLAELNMNRRQLMLPEVTAIHTPN